MEQPTIYIRPYRTRTYKKAKMPKWAADLVTKICGEYDVPIPPISWKKHENDWSSGVTSIYGITIRAGKSKKDIRYVVVHELAHWIVRRKSGSSHHHDLVFFGLAFTLYQDKSNKVSLKHAKRREFRYKTRNAPKAWKQRKTDENVYKHWKVS